MARFGAAFRGALPATIAIGGRAPVGRAFASGAAAAFPEIAIPTALGAELVRTIADSAKGLHDFAEGLTSVNRRLAAYSGTLAQAYAELGVHEFGRQMATARDVAPSALGLVKAVDEMRDALQPFRAAGMNLQNTLGGAAAGFIGGTANQFAAIPELVNVLRERLDPSSSSAADFGKHLADSIWSYFKPVTEGMYAILREYFPKTAAALEEANKRADEARRKLEEARHAIGPWDQILVDNARNIVRNPPGGIAFNVKF